MASNSLVIASKTQVLSFQLLELILTLNLITNKMTWLNNGDGL